MGADSTEWELTDGAHTTTATDGSARVRIRCAYGSAGTQILVDDVLLRQDVPLSDDFELSCATRK